MSDRDPEFLYSLDGGEEAYDDPAAVYESEIEPWGLRDRVLIEKYTALPAGHFLPSVEWVAEWVAEHSADNMGTDGAPEAWTAAEKVPEVVAAFRSAMDLLAGHVHYSMCGEKVGTHTLTFDSDGEPMLDGEPLYRPRKED